MKRRKKLFKEINFETNADINTIFPTMPPSISEDKMVVNHPDTSGTFGSDYLGSNVTPSKSEFDSFNGFESSINTFTLNEDTSDVSSSEDDSFFYESLKGELIDEDFNMSRTEIVSISSHKPKETINGESKPKRAKKVTRVKNNVTVSSDTSVQYHQTPDGTIVILSKNEIVYFYGLMLVSVLHGEIEILGYKLTKNSPEAKVYSPRGAALLYLKNVTKSKLALSNYLLNLNISQQENCAVIICKKLEEEQICFIEKHMSQQILPQCNDFTLPRVVFQPEGSWNLFKTNPEWNVIIDGINHKTRMAIVGGKGVGKTTFLRYAINRLLLKFEQVRIIDLDPGQSEFTVPGCISVITINEPIFGANFTHIKNPQRSILSNVNIAYEPEKYIASVQYLMETILNESNIPTLINFMGFIHGIGHNILSAVITCLEPTDILQIFSQDSTKNYKSGLQPEVVRENSKLFTKSDSDLNYKFHSLESMSDSNDGWTAEPRQLREMCVLAYLSQMLETKSIFRMKRDVPIYKISLVNISLSSLNGEQIHPAAVNASLVALCSLVDRENYIFECHGWGIVRGVDISDNTLYLLTPEEGEILQQVSHLVLASVMLPPSIFMTPDEIKGQIPYVIDGVLTSLGRIPKRARISIKKKK